MNNYNKTIGFESDTPGMSFFSKERIHRYKFAKGLINFLSLISNGRGRPRPIKIDWTSIRRIGHFLSMGYRRCCPDDSFVKNYSKSFQRENRADRKALLAGPIHAFGYL